MNGANDFSSIRPDPTIDRHFGNFINRFGKGDNPYLQPIASLLSRRLASGHACLDLRGLYQSRNFEDCGIGELPPFEELLQSMRDSGPVGFPGEFKPLLLEPSGKLFLHRYWTYENQVAEAILSRFSSSPPFLDPEALEKALKAIFPREQNGEPNQGELAALTALLHPFTIISGGPGTGKTTLIAGIIALSHALRHGGQLRIALAAPTGKAAARLKDVVPMELKRLPCPEPLADELSRHTATLHRLLRPRPGSLAFHYNRRNPLPLDLLVVDECTMIDLSLMAKLLQALPPSARIVLLGDKDQLTSVEAGSVFSDLAAAASRAGPEPSILRLHEKTTNRTFPAEWEKPDSQVPLRGSLVELRKNYRFTPDSGMRKLCHAIKRGDADGAIGALDNPDLPEITRDALPRPRNLKEAIGDHLLPLFRKMRGAKDAGEAIARFAAFRILCAHRKGPYGVEAVNRLSIQLLRDADLLPMAGLPFHGMPILVTQNDYALRLFNGDTGVFYSQPGDRKENLTAYFQSEEGLRAFFRSRLPRFEPAFAMTVHKCQGSEFEEILFILPEKESPLLSRELIYTGVSRARSKVRLLADPEVFAKGINRKMQRDSGLADRFAGKAPSSDISYPS